MSIRIFAINLDRSVDRWQKLSAKANEFGRSVPRVPLSMASGQRKTRERQLTTSPSGAIPVA